MFRFSLATFLIVVAVVSLVFAGLAFPNAFWMRIVATLTLAAILAAVIAVLASLKTARWFWIGFAVAGWSYLGFVFYGGDGARNVLLTHSAILQLDLMLETSTPVLAPSGQAVTLHGDTIYLASGLHPGERLSLEEAEQQGYLKYAYAPNAIPRREHFHDIGHYSWALLVGCIGGMFSLWLHRRSTAMEQS